MSPCCGWSLQTGTVHRHFPSKEALYLAVAIDQLEQLVAEAKQIAANGTPDVALLSRMMASGARNATVKTALAAADTTCEPPRRSRDE
ncbi:TetR/AcrR family transcriptional regulator [Nocardia sp. NPDC004085]